MMESIGGYFSLELPLHGEYHKDALRLNTGRNCLEYILRARQYKKVYIPYYTCDSVLEPFHKLHIGYTFYHININLELEELPDLQEGEALLYTNYFGLKQRYAEQLADRYGSRLIVDNTQAFFAKPTEGIDTFYSCRKFFGVPDGAYLYTDTTLDEAFEQDLSYDRMSHLLKRIDLSAEEGFADFHRNDASLSGQAIKRMSRLTQRLMESIDYENVINKRRENFLTLHQHLRESNQLQLEWDEDTVPMVYPYMTDRTGLRNHLIANRIYVARYWPNVLDWTKKESNEYKLTKYLVPLPVDQRYGEKDILKLIDTIHGADSLIQGF